MKAVRYFFSWLFAMTAAILLTVSAFLLPLIHTLIVPEVHYAISSDPAVITAQNTYIKTSIQELAEQYHFSVETVMNAISQESLLDYNHQVTDWWLGFFKEKMPSSIPEYDVKPLSDLLNADKGLKAAVGNRRLKSTITDKILPAFKNIIRKAVFPMQDGAITLAVSTLRKKVDIPRLFSLLPMLCGAFAGSAVLLTLLSALFSFRLPCCGRVFAGSTFWAAALLVLLTSIAFHLSGAMTALNDASPRLALQLSLLLKERAPMFAGIGIGYALLGTGLYLLAPRRCK